MADGSGGGSLDIRLNRRLTARRSEDEQQPAGPSRPTRRPKRAVTALGDDSCSIARRLDVLVDRRHWSSRLCLVGGEFRIPVSAGYALFHDDVRRAQVC